MIIRTKKIQVKFSFFSFARACVCVCVLLFLGGELIASLILWYMLIVCGNAYVYKYAFLFLMLNLFCCLALTLIVYTLSINRNHTNEIKFYRWKFWIRRKVLNANIKYKYNTIIMFFWCLWTWFSVLRELLTFQFKFVWMRVCRWIS